MLNILQRSVSELIWEKAKNLQFDLICGLPYQGIPLATVSFSRATIEPRGNLQGISKFQCSKSCGGWKFL